MSGGTDAAAAHSGAGCGEDEVDANVAAACKAKVYHLSVVFFLVYTAFSGIQSLEASIIGGHCRGCDEVCWAGGAACVDSAVATPRLPADMTCSFTHPSTGAVLCAMRGGACGEGCPNTDGGGVVEVLANQSTAYPEFAPCGGENNVGAVSIAVVYAVFTGCCLVGGRVAAYLGTRLAIAAGMGMITCFCAANFVVALSPSSSALQWGALIPSSALVGVAAAVIWPAQGTCIARLSARHARSVRGADPTATLGAFFGTFFSFHQSTQITGNLVAGVLLEHARLPVAWLMFMYLACAGAGTLVALYTLSDIDADDIPASPGPATAARSRTGVSAGHANEECPACDAVNDAVSQEVEEEDDDEESSNVVATSYRNAAGTDATAMERVASESLCAAIFGMTALWTNRAMLLLIPTFMCAGVCEAFAWGVFTSEWVRGSLGVGNIGYVMAVFGACDVCAAVAIGQLSDRVSRYTILTAGAACNLSVLLILRFVEVRNCDRQWGVLGLCAGLWGVADAVWITQLSCLMGGMFPAHKEDAFANLKLWQSVATATLFALGFDRGLMTRRAWLDVVTCCLVLGFGSCSVAYCMTGFRAADTAPYRPTSSRAYAPLPRAPAVNGNEEASTGEVDLDAQNDAADVV